MNTNDLCLGILSLGDATGYEIKKAFEQTFSHFQAASFGAIYPALAKLSDQGLVSYREEQQAKRPTKKVFTLTPAGRQQFLQTLSDTPPAEQHRSDFLFLMMFAHLMPADQLSKLLGEQTDHLRQELETLERIMGECQTLTPGMRFTLEYGIEAKQALLKLLQRRSPALLDEIEQARSIETS